MESKPKKKRVKSQKLNPGWRPGRKKRRRHLAATMIQKCFRSYLLRKAFKETRNSVKDSFLALRAFHHARNRARFRHVDLHSLSRDELRLIALSVNVPSTGKKVLLIGRIQRWIDQNIMVKNIAVDAASTALEKQVRAQGTVYFCEAVPGLNPIEIRPLRGENLSRMAAGHESDAVYAIDGRDGSVWLCKTGGLSSQVGLCRDNLKGSEGELFDHPLESRWLVNPAFMHTLRADHINDVQVARSHAVARARAGEIFSWGENQHGQLGYPALSADDVARNRAKVVAGIANYPCVSVAVGTHHTIAVCDQVAGRNGIVFAWGSNVYGQLGTGSTATAGSPSKKNPSILVVSPPPSNQARVQQFPKAFVLHRVDALHHVAIKKVACGALHSMAVTTDGKLFTWGSNDGGRLGLGLGHSLSKQEQRICRPTQVSGPLARMRVFDIACGAWHSACIAEAEGMNQDEESRGSHMHGGKVFVWGTGIYGQLGVGNHIQVLYFPAPVRVPSEVIQEEETAVQIACGMHHTAVLTSANNVYTWGSTQSFSATPQRLRLADGTPFGKIASIACGRTFTVYNTLSLTSQSYEREEAYRLWRAKQLLIPKLDLSKIPRAPLSSSCPGVDGPLPLRLEPEADRKARVAFEDAERKRIDAIDIEAIVHPLCRVCWRCNGFQPSPLKLWICRHCFHEKDLHGIRPKDAPLSEYEAVRKIQCLFRARRAKRVLQQAREKHYQRVFSIKHNEFFYYNLWRNTVSWEHPAEITHEVVIPIRDPDEKPIIRPPLTRVEAAIVLQKNWRAHSSHLECKRRLKAKYEKHFDFKNERVYYKVIEKPPPLPQAIGQEQRLVLWEDPPLLRRLYDLGEPIEITRLKRYANLSRDDAARVIQRLCRRFNARQFMKRIVQSRVRKLFDEATGEFYYYNTVTKVSTWEKLKVLGSEIDEEDDPAAELPVHNKLQQSPVDRPTKRPKTRPPRQDKFDTNDAAASTIQALFRRYRSRKLFFDLLRQRYLKIMDENTMRPYYYDRVNGVSTWLKPIVFGAFDLELHALPTASSRDATAPSVFSRPQRRQVPYISKKARIKREKRRLQKLRQRLTPHEAACYIQRAWYYSRARMELRKLLIEAYEKIYDETTGEYYYYNTKTGKVSWEKPVLLDDSEVRVARLVKRRREYTITDPVEAKTVVEGFCRRCLARKEVLRLLHDRIQKVFDPETKKYYYFDRCKGQSSWKKPLLLKDQDLPTTQ